MRHVTPPEHVHDDRGANVGQTRRRVHRKSRAGCGECKQRRIKCDEIRPLCGQCQKSGRNCPFTSQNTSPSAVSNVDTPGSLDPGTSNAGSFMPTSMSGAANMMQLRLLNHFLTEMSVLPFPAAGFADAMSCARLAAMSEDCEYLMTEILAFSARHLAYSQPHQRFLYLEQSELFHARAISLFSSTQVDLDSTRALNIVFFSWLVGTHHLSGMALSSTQETPMLSRFLEFADIFRGARTMTLAAWHRLRESDESQMLDNYLSQGAASISRRSRGVQTSRLKSLIYDSLGLTEEAKNSHVRALDLIQSVIDVKLDENIPETGQDDCIQMCFTWPLAVDREIFDLAKQRRPEPLLVLAFFAVILYWCKEFWIIGETGRLLLENISESIGPGWEQWLQWPMSMVERTCTGPPISHRSINEYD